MSLISRRSKTALIQIRKAWVRGQFETVKLRGVDCQEPCWAGALAYSVKLACQSKLTTQTRHKMGRPVLLRLRVLENMVELVGIELPSHPENRQVIESW